MASMVYMDGSTAKKLVACCRKLLRHGFTGVYRIIAAGMIVKGWRQRGCQPMPYGTGTVLGSHCCVGLSPVKATELYHAMPEAESVKLKGFAGESARKLPTLLYESHIDKAWRIEQ